MAAICLATSVQAQIVGQTLGVLGYLNVAPVVNGGTGLTSGTVGGILCFAGDTTTIAVGPINTNHALVVGGGGGTCPSALLTLGTSTQVLHGNAAGDPTWGAVGLATDVSGVLPVANGGTNASSASGTALDNITGFSGTGFLTRTGAGAYAFQSATNGITLGNLAQSGANTMLGNWTGSTANVSANAMPSCPDSAGNHLNYVSGTGITCGTGLGSGITALTGDVTASGPGSAAATLATVNSNVGTFGSSTAIPVVTVNGKGLTTAVTTAAVIAPAGTLSGSTLAAGVTASSLTSAAGGSFGTAAFVATGTSGATVPLLNGANSWSAAQTITGDTNKVSLTNTATTEYLRLTTPKGWTGSGSNVTDGVVGSLGNIYFYNGVTNSMIVTSSEIDLYPSLIAMPGIGMDTGLTDTTVCRVNSTSALKVGSGTLGICLGTSSARYKTGIAPLAPGLQEIMALRPKSFYLDKAHGDPKKQMYGFIAEDMVKVLPKLVGLDKQKRPNTADYLGLVPVLVKAVQAQQGQIIALQATNADLVRRLNVVEHH